MCSKTAKTYRGLESQPSKKETFIYRKGVSRSSQLGLSLSLLEHRLHLRSLHNVAFDLQLATHEQTLGVGLARDEGRKIGIGEGKGDYIVREKKRLV